MTTTIAMDAIRSLERLTYNPKQEPEALVNKRCMWCKAAMEIPKNYKLCPMCDLAMNDERRRRNKEDKRKRREEAKQKQEGSGVDSQERCGEDSVDDAVTTHMCSHCQNVELKGNKKYCDADECQEAKAVHKAEIDKNRKKENYYATRALKMKEVQDKTVTILNCYKNKDMEAIKNFSQEEKTNALLAFVSQLSADEYDNLLMDIIAEDEDEE